MIIQVSPYLYINPENIESIEITSNMEHNFVHMVSKEIIPLTDKELKVLLDNTPLPE